MRGWNEFTKYLKKSILKTQKNSSELKLTDKASQKYLTNESEKAKKDELELVLNNLLLSVKNCFSFSESSDNYHNLPYCTEVIGEGDDEQLIYISTWSKIFPKRKETFFGPKSTKAEISQEVWTIMAGIYEDWVENEELLEELADKGKEINQQAESGVNDWAIKKGAKVLYAKKGIKVLTEIKEWLEKFKQLDPDKKDELDESKKKMEELKKALEEVVAESKKDKNTQNSENPSNNIPWKGIFKYGGGGLLILIGVGIIIKLLKD